MFLYDHRVYRLLLARLFDTMTSGLFMMALPWLMLKLGYSGSTVAIITLLCTMTSFIMTPYLSILIDKFSRKRILVAIQGTQLLIALILLLSATMNIVELSILTLTRLIFWVSTDMAWDATNALIQENFERREYAKITSYQMIIRQSTFLGSAAAGVVLLERWSVDAFALFAVMAALLSLCFYLWMPYTRQFSGQVQVRSVWKMVQEMKSVVLNNGKYFYLFSLSSLSYVVMTYLSQLMLIYLAIKGYRGDWYALWNTGTSLGGILSGLVIRFVLRKWMKQQVILGCLFVMAAFSLILGFVFLPIIFIVIAVILGFLNILNNIARTSLMHEVVNMRERGRLDGSLKLVTTVSQSIAYAMISIFSYANALSLGFYFIAFCLLLCALFSLRIIKQINVHVSTKI